MHDCIIIGAGPAGATAAIYLKRKNKDVLVISKDLGTLGHYETTIENYYGFENPIIGSDLIKSGLKQMANLGITHIDDVVFSIDEQSGVFKVKTSKNIYESKSLLLAVGKARASLSIPGFVKYRGKGISFCATCDGYFYRNKRIAILGASDYMLEELSALLPLSENITIFTNGQDLDTTVSHPVITNKIKEFKGNEKLESIITDDGKEYFVDGLFVAIDSPGINEFAQKIGILLDKNFISVDENYMTNIEGLFAAGDIVKGQAQIIKAAYDGMRSALAIDSYLKNKKN